LGKTSHNEVFKQLQTGAKAEILCPELTVLSKDNLKTDLTNKIKNHSLIASGGLHKDLKKSLSTINDDEPIYNAKMVEFSELEDLSVH
jgi:hypothetical protein